VENDASVTHTDWESQRERISAYLDGELSLEERAGLEAHLPTCDDCQRELAAMRQMRALLGALPAPALPRSFTLPETPVIATGRRSGPPRWSRPAQTFGGLAAAIGLGLLVTSALPHPATLSSSASTSFGAPSTAAGAATLAPRQTSVPTYGPNHTPAYRPQTTESAQPFPVLPVTGTTLLVGGAAALTLGSLARRRRRDAGLPEAEPVN